MLIVTQEKGRDTGIDAEKENDSQDKEKVTLKESEASAMLGMSCFTLYVCIYIIKGLFIQVESPSASASSAVSPLNHEHSALIPKRGWSL